MAPKIVPLERKDLPRAAACLARAFQDDPLQTYVLPDPEERAVQAGLDRLHDVLGAAAADRFLSVLSDIDPYHQTDVPADHWYVFVLGVDPAAQGLGLGRALLAPVLEEARRDRVPCYLETAQPRNVPFYQHLGFRVVREVVHEESGLPLWTFRLDP